MLNGLEALKNVNIERNDAEELVYLLAAARSMKVEFERLNMEVPEWLDETARKLQREINSRNADSVANRKKSIRATLESLKTPAQKREELEAELAKLDAAVA